MWDDVKHNMTYLGLWLTGRGVVSLTMLSAVFLKVVDPIVAPIIAVTIGIGTGSYFAFREANYRKQRTANSYRNEIAATLGKDPREVTVDDLELVAEGSRRAGLPLNRTLDERWDNISLRRTLSVASHLIGALVAGAAVLTLFPDMLGPTLEHGGSIVSSLLGVGADTGTRIVSSLCAGAITFSVDNLVYASGEHLLGLNHANLYEHIQLLKRQMRSGVALSNDDTLGLFVHADRTLDAAIHTRFGQPYDALTREQRAYVLDLADPVFHVRDITTALNEKRIHANELAFILDGRRSGTTEKCVTGRCDEREVLDIFKGLRREHAPKIDHVSTAAVSVHPDIGQLMYQDGPPPVLQEPVRSFVERYGALQPAGSYQERVSSMPGLGRVH